jgi:hypothetical protein
MIYYLLTFSHGYFIHTMGLFSTVAKANKVLETTFGNHRSYFETHESNGVKLDYEIEAKHPESGYVYISLTALRVDENIWRSK